MWNIKIYTEFHRFVCITLRKYLTVPLEKKYVSDFSVYLRGRNAGDTQSWLSEPFADYRQSSFSTAIDTSIVSIARAITQISFAVILSPGHELLIVSATSVASENVHIFYRRNSWTIRTRIGAIFLTSYFVTMWIRNGISLELIICTSTLIINSPTHTKLKIYFQIKLSDLSCPYFAHVYMIFIFALLSLISCTRE